MKWRVQRHSDMYSDTHETGRDYVSDTTAFLDWQVGGLIFSSQDSLYTNIHSLLYTMKWRVQRNQIIMYSDTHETGRDYVSGLDSVPLLISTKWLAFFFSGQFLKIQNASFDQLLGHLLGPASLIGEIAFSHKFWSSVHYYSNAASVFVFISV